MPAPHAQNEFHPSSGACRLRSDDPDWASVISGVNVDTGSHSTVEMLRAIRRSGLLDARQVLAAGEGSRWSWYKGLWHVGRPTTLPIEYEPAHMQAMARDPMVEMLRERAFAMSEQGVHYKAIAKELGVNHSTAWHYVREMRRRKMGSVS